MKRFMQNVISWALLVGILVGVTWVGQGELLRWHSSERLKLISLERDLVLAKRQAAELPERRSTLESLRASGTGATIYWPGSSPASALLDLQEFANETVGKAGLSLVAVEARRPDPESPALMRMTMRATGTISALQRALLDIEQHTPTVVIPQTRIEIGRETSGDPLLDVRLELRALHQSAKKAQADAD